MQANPLPAEPHGSFESFIYATLLIFLSLCTPFIQTHLTNRVITPQALPSNLPIQACRRLKGLGLFLFSYLSNKRWKFTLITANYLEQLASPLVSSDKLIKLS